VVKEGRILNFVSGDRRFEFESITYNEMSCFVDKRLEISNQNLIKDITELVELVAMIS